MHNMKKALIIGIDGGTWTVINPLLQQGKLPTFKRLIKNGASGTLKSVPPLSAPAWSSITTGKEMRNHGVFSFAKRDKKYNLKALSSKDKFCGDFWENIKKSTIINVPFTYPVKKEPQLMISGMMSPGVNEKSVYPPREIEYLKRNDYMIEPTKNLKSIREAVEKRTKIMFHYMRKYEWQLFFIVFREFDPLQHYFWDEVPKYYMYMDELLSKLLSILDERINLFIISDHGFNRVQKSFLIKNWLRRKSYMKVREGKEKKRKTPRSIILNALRQLVSSKMKSELRKSGIKNHKLIKLFSEKASKTEAREEEEEIDFKNSRVFPGAWGGLYINKKGEFRNGFLNEEEARRTKKQVMERLESLTDKENREKIIDFVSSFDEEHFPDIFFYQNCKKGYSTSYVKKESNKLLIPAKKVQKKGDHTEDAIFLAWGPDIKKEVRLSGKSTLADFAPTLLKVLDSKPQKSVNGEVLTEILK